VKLSWCVTLPHASEFAIALARSRRMLQAQAQAAEEAERAAMAVEDFKMMKVSAACVF
jgi:hypothetical protein